MCSRVSKIGFLLLLPFIFEFPSCCNKDCTPTTFVQYTNCTIEAENLDNSGAVAIVSTDSIINKNAYGIRLSIHRQVNICQGHTTFSIFPSAKAHSTCSCEPPFYFDAYDNIISVKIKTLKDFNQNHVSGADITDMFKIFDEMQFVDVPDYNIPSSGHSDNDDILDIEIDLLLFATDVYNVNQQFQVLVDLTDGRTLTATTNIVLLD